VGDRVGDGVRNLDGKADGMFVAATTGFLDGDFVDETIGKSVGKSVGSSVRVVVEFPKNA